MGKIWNCSRSIVICKSVEKEFRIYDRKKRFLNSTLHFPNYEGLWACSQFPAHRMTYILSLNFSSEPGFQLRQLLSISFDAISFKDWILLHTPVKLVTWESLSRRSFVNYACIDALSFINNKDIYWNMKL